MVALFAGLLAPQASARDHHRHHYDRRVVIVERPYYGYSRPYYSSYDSPYYDDYCERPYYRTYHTYHRHYSSRPRFSFAFGF